MKGFTSIKVISFEIISFQMEVKLWVPDFLKIDPGNQLIWDGPENVPVGSVLYPYQSPTLQTLKYSKIEEIPSQVKKV